LSPCPFSFTRSLLLASYTPVWRCGLGGRVRGVLLRAVIAAFSRAVSNSAFLLRSLLKRKWRVANRAGFRNGFVPEDRIALGIFRAAVKCFAALGFLDDYLAATARARAGHARRLALNVIALRVIRAGDELAEAPMSPDKIRAVHRALLVELNGSRRDRAAPRYLTYVSALRITRAAQKLPEAPAL
jgi:hypothetical protein